MYNLDEEIKAFKKRICEVYNSTKEFRKANIYRGHLRSISSDIEDCIAEFLISILPDEYKIFIDSSIYIDKKTHRPDILILDSGNNVKALVEVKSNMGWCRDASNVMSDICVNRGIYERERNLTCSYLNNDDREKLNVKYSNVPIFLVALTGQNSSDNLHKKNKITAKEKDIYHYILFKKWYDELEDYEIKEFILKILEVTKYN